MKHVMRSFPTVLPRSKRRSCQCGGQVQIVGSPPGEGSDHSVFLHRKSAGRAEWAAISKYGRNNSAASTTCHFSESETVNRHYCGRYLGQKTGELRKNEDFKIPYSPLPWRSMVKTAPSLAGTGVRPWSGDPIATQTAAFTSTTWNLQGSSALQRSHRDEKRGHPNGGCRMQQERTLCVTGTTHLAEGLQQKDCGHRRPRVHSRRTPTVTAERDPTCLQAEAPLWLRGPRVPAEGYGHGQKDPAVAGAYHTAGEDYSGGPHGHL